LVIWRNHEYIDTMQRRLRLDRRLVNLLTACRLYLDQTDHVISSVFGSESKERERIKLFKSKQYDMHWGYRLMEALRNHAQHAGLIVHVIAHHYEHSRDQNGHVTATEFTVIPHTTVQTLAQNPEFKKSVLEELKKKGKDIDLRRPIRQYVACLMSIHSEIRDLLKARTAEARIAYEAALIEFGKHEGNVVYFPTLQELDDAGNTVTRVQLVSEFLEALDSLSKKNSGFDSLPLHFASNRALE